MEIPKSEAEVMTMPRHTAERGLAIDDEDVRHTAPPELDGGGETGRAAADNEDVDGRGTHGSSARPSTCSARPPVAAASIAATVARQ